MKFYLPQDTTALALGADKVAEQLTTLAKQRKLDIELVRNGSRGLFWLEPLLEVEIDNKRIAFAAVQSEQLESILDVLQKEPGSHPNYLGSTEEIPQLAKQQRLTMRRAGLAEPLDLEAYQSMQGFVGLKKALELSPQAIVDQVKESGLRGRGGAAFPTGIKWQTVLDTGGAKPQEVQKYIVCNADEGDSGTFADRLLMEADPYQLIEGMVIAGLAMGANKGYIYLRSEYPRAHSILQAAIEQAQQAGFLGQGILGSQHDFELQVRLGAGAYICGEETSLLDSLEGKRGLVRAKPPLPAIEGLFGQPTVVNNVLSFAAVTTILEKGADFYQDYGVERSRGTLPFQLAGNIKQGGVVELAYGTTLLELIDDFGGGTLSGRPIRAVQVGGPLGAYLSAEQLDVPLDYEAFAKLGAMLGHGGVVVFDDSVDMAQQARFAMEFCAVESCGKCTPCRIGAVRGVEVIDKIIDNQNRADNIDLLNELCDTMEFGSLCAMGGMTPFPVRSAMQHFAEDFEK